MNKVSRMILALSMLIGIAVASNPPAADGVLRDSENLAKKEHKNVLLIFHASWCGWCHKLDDFLADPKMAKIMNANYEIIHVDVLENGDKKSLENPGGLDLMEKVGGKDGGLPFYVVLSPSGTTLASSAKPGTGPAGERNIGFPSKPEEVDYFMQILHGTGTRLSGSDETAVKSYLKSNGG